MPSSQSLRYDVHTHAFHPKIADKVVAQLHEHYDIKPEGTGLIEDLLVRERQAGVDKFVVLCAATAPAQVIPANNWIIELQEKYDEVIGFGTLHPEYKDWEKEVERLKRAGIIGLKFHPEFQGFWMDDPRLLPLMEATHKDFIYIFHVGDRAAPKDNPSCPIKLAALARQFPDARIIAAHFGGYLHWKWALEELVGTNVYLDTSSSLSFIPDDMLQAIMDRHPFERLLFGSDFPVFDPVLEVERAQRRMHLSDSRLEALMGNAGELFSA